MRSYRNWIAAKSLHVTYCLGCSPDGRHLCDQGADLHDLVLADRDRETSPEALDTRPASLIEYRARRTLLDAALGTLTHKGLAALAAVEVG